MKLILIALAAVAAVALAEEETACKTTDGTIYKNGETWEQKNSFKMRCVVEPNGSWHTEVVSCKTPTGVEVPVNETKEEGAHEWSCTAGSEGQITLTQKRGKNADCDNGKKKGEKWVESQFEFECAEGGVPVFVGCVAPNGEKIKDGDVMEVSGQKIQCVKHANGTVAMQSLPKEKNAQCDAKDGTKHATGATWIESTMFEYECGEFGKKNIKGCVVKEHDLNIPINETRTKGSTVFHCENKDGSFKFFTTPA